MSLFELFGDTKGKKRANHEKPADLSFQPENELVELVWQNGQVMMQGQSSRATRNPSLYNSYGFQPYSLPSHSPKRDKDLSSAPHSSSSDKFRTLDSGMDEFPVPVPLGEMCLNGDDDMVPWFDHPIDESLRNYYGSDFLPELSGVTEHQPSQNEFSTIKRGDCSNHVYSDHNIHSADSRLDHRNSFKGSSLAVVSKAMRPGTSHTPAGQSQLPSLIPRQVSENTGKSTSNDCVSGDPSQVTNSTVGVSSEKLRKQNPGPSVNSNEFLNFPHFSRPAVHYKSTLGNSCVITDSTPSSLDRAGFNQKGSSPDVTTVKSNSGPMRKMRSHDQFVEKQATDTRSLEAKPAAEPPVKESEEIRQGNVANHDKQSNESGGASTSREHQDAVEPVVASSVCSGNGVESVSDNPPTNLKRKGRSSNYDSEAPSEDVEEDSGDLKKSAHERGGGSKRSRAAEVHNLSERRRRDRINKKMRALQELIPNCNKVDKASMLDEAIDYLKTLQLQVQMMSMGAGLYMPPMMFPAHMAQFSPMSGAMAAGLGFRMGMVEPNSGPTACPMLRIPPMHGAHFPSPIMSGNQALHGMSGSSFPVMGVPSQGLPLTMPHVPPLAPFPGGPPLRPPAGSNASAATAAMENTDAAFASSSKEAAENINGASWSMNHTSSQCQSRNGCPEQPEDGATTSTTFPGDDTEPSEEAIQEKLV